MRHLFRKENGQGRVGYGLMMALAALAAEVGITAAGSRAAELLGSLSGLLSL